MKRYKKLWALLLAVTMTVSALSGCGSNQQSASAPKNGTEQQASSSGKLEPIDVTVAIWGIEDSLSGGKNDKILQKIEEKTGVHIIPQNITWDDSEQKIKLWAASNSLPDIFTGGFVGTSFFYDWVNQGVIRSLPNDLSKHPNLEKYMKMGRAQSAKQNDKFYMIPRQTYGDITYSVQDRSVAYRWDLAKAAGVTKEPETYDEFRDMIKKIIAADPEKKKVAGLTTTLPDLLGGFILPYGIPNEKKWVKKDNQYMPGYFAGDMVSAFSLARDMYKEGTIEKDISLAKLNTSVEKFLQGQSAAMVIAGSGPASLYNTVARDYEKLYPQKKFLDDVKVCKLFSCKDGKRNYFVDTEAWSESYFSSKVDDKKMDRILGLYDFLYSDEGKRLVFCGIEGEDYDVAGETVIMRAGINLNDKYPFTKSLSNLGMWNPADWDPTFPSDVPAQYRALNVARHQDALDNGTLPKYSDAVLFLSTPLKDKFTWNSTDDLMQIMMGTKPVDKMVKDLMTNYENKGLSKMLKEVNEKAEKLGL